MDSPVAVLSVIAVLIPVAASAGPKFTVLHEFGGGRDGASPLPGSAAGLIADGNGVLYGAAAGESMGSDHGVIFKLVPPAAGKVKWTETVLYRFKGGKDGGFPGSALLLDSDGALYGAAFEGGRGSCLFGTVVGCGTVFKLSPPATGQTAWTLQTLYEFRGGADGGSPTSNLTVGPDGALYGMTLVGGTATTACPAGYVSAGCGVAFRVAPPATSGGEWTETVIHDFQGVTDGATPEAGLTAAQDGSFYGVTAYGGCVDTCASGTIGFGTVFKLTPPQSSSSRWRESLLYRFTGGADGEYPQPPPIVDSSGALVGTTYGNFSSAPSGYGNVYRLVQSATNPEKWTQTVLYAFKGGTDGNSPNAGLTPLAKGDYALTTFYGGTGPCTGYVPGCGTLIKLSPPAKDGDPWVETVLYSLNGATDGAYPAGGIYVDGNGILYSGATSGGTGPCPNSNEIAGCGTVFSFPAVKRWDTAGKHPS